MCRRSSLVVLTLLAQSLCSHAQTQAQEAIPVKTLTEIKAATVFVKASLQGLEGSGSGFVIKVDGYTAYVATNDHVVNPKPRNITTGRHYSTPVGKPSLTIVFDSGTLRERSARGEILASDPDRDLAVVKVEGIKDLPRPLDYEDNAELIETMPVYTFGFPLGQLLATNRKGPAITVGRGTISSIRTDDAGNIALVQIDGALNPGNSGGPVVGVKGNLIGIAVATIQGAQQIGLTIPQKQLIKMLDGRAGSAVLTTRKVDGSDAEVDVEVGLIDPLHRIKEVAILYVHGNPVGFQSRKSSTAKFEPLPDGKRAVLNVEGAKAQGKLSLKLPQINDYRLTFQIVVTNGSGEELYSQPSTYILSKTSIAVARNVTQPTHSRTTRPHTVIVPRRPTPSTTPPRIVPPNPRFIPSPPTFRNDDALLGKGKIEPFLGVVVSPERKLVLTSTTRSFLKLYTYPDFRLKGSYKLRGPATHLAFDSRRNQLYAHVTSVERLQTNTPGKSPSGLGDLLVYDLNDILTGKDSTTTELTETASIELNANTKKMLLSKNSEHLYILTEQSQGMDAPGKLFRIQTAQNQADLDRDFEKGVESMCLSPDGTSLYVAVSPLGHKYYSMDRPEEGKLFLIDPATLEILKTALIELDPCDIQANDLGQVYVCGGSNQHTTIAVVDMKMARAIVAQWRGVFMGASIQLSNDTQRLYVAERMVSPASIKEWKLPADLDEKPVVSDVPSVQGSGFGGEIFLTPDNRFVLTRNGGVTPIEIR